MNTFVRDLIERALSTYVQVFIGLLIAGGVFDAEGVDLTAAKAAAVSAIPAALSVIKSLIASKFGNAESASLDPKV